MTARMKKSTIDIILGVSTIIQISFIPRPIFTGFKYIVITYLVLKYCEEIIKNKIQIGLLLTYTTILTYSSWINTGSITWTLSAFMSGFNYIAIFVLFISFSKKRGNDKLITFLAKILFIFLLVNDTLMVVLPYDFSYAEEIYFLGNKFQVSFLHCFLGGLLFVKKRTPIKRFQALLFIFFSIFISAITHCTTGILTSIVFILLVLIPDRLKKIIEKPYIFLTALSIENVLIWGSANIFKHPLFINIITNVFHKSTNMTGREKLYAVTLNLVSKKPLWGYGHNTDVYRDLFGYGNAQNGLFHIIIQAGIIGAIVYFIAVGIAITNKDKGHYSYGMYIFIYAMLVASAVEISLSNIFMMGIAVIWACNLNIARKQKATVHNYINDNNIMNVKNGLLKESCI